MRIVLITAAVAAAAAVIAPSTRSISDGQYPLVDSWFLGHDKKGRERAQALCDWLVSETGQTRMAKFRCNTDK